MSLYTITEYVHDQTNLQNRPSVKDNIYCNESNPSVHHTNEFHTSTFKTVILDGHVSRILVVEYKYLVQNITGFKAK